MTDKVDLAKLKELKKQSKRFSILTCYDYSTAVLLQEAQVDSLLVGDSLAQVILGYSSTLPATMDVMIPLTAAVRRGAPKVYLIGDMPFLSYQSSIESAILNAGRFMTEAGCDAVKVEVDYRHVETVSALSAAGIPVVAHLGYRPQTSLQSDRIVESRDLEKAKQLIRDCQAMIEVGAVMILLECVTSRVARAVTELSELPVISCGSGPHCDGQVLVLHEALGLPGAVNPLFSKCYADIGRQINTAASEYSRQVKSGEYPDEAHSYQMDNEVETKFEQWLAEGR